MSSVTLTNVTKAFGDNVVLKDFCDTFADGEFVTLLGPSGCGKTTLLRMIAGFEKPTAGIVKIGDHTVNDGRVFVPPEKRDIGMVFQSYAVWPHMTVFDNVAYPLKIKKTPKPLIAEKVAHVLGITHLKQYDKRYPNQLSGGQQQRVALARALVAEPKLLLLDEPLSNLDAKLRESMRFEIKDIQSQLGITVVYVTHDQSEAMAMSDRVIVIRQGDIQQIGKPETIYRRPVNPFVADFVGKVDFLEAMAQQGSVRLPGGSRMLEDDGGHLADGPVIVAVRPEALRFVSDGTGHMSGTLLSAAFLGETYDCRVQLAPDVSLRVRTEGMTDSLPPVGSRVGLEVLSFMVFPAGSVEDDLIIRT
jgi:iron(III) transport system ATP-binding protein